MIAARGFQNDMFFPMALVAFVGLPHLQGTVHVNMASALKFMPNYMFRPADAGLAALRDCPSGVHLRARSVPCPPGCGSRPAVIEPIAKIPVVPPRWGGPVAGVERRRDFTNDDFLFNQGASRGLSKVAFGDWREVLAGSRTSPTSRCFTSRPRASSHCWPPPNRHLNSSVTSTFFLRWASCSRCCRMRS